MYRQEEYKKEIIAVFDDYIQAYFAERNPEKTFALFSPKVTGFGTGIDEIAIKEGQIKELYLRDFAQAPNPIDVEYASKDVVIINETSGIVNAQFSIKTVISGQPVNLNNLRLSVLFVMDSDKWSICHMHISFPAAEHEEGESFPLKELEEKNRVLEQMVKEKTAELELRNKTLEDALLRVRQLSGLLPICSSCKKIRDDNGEWIQVETYLRNHSEAEFTHSYCSDCGKKILSELSELKKKK